MPGPGDKKLSRSCCRRRDVAENFGPELPTPLAFCISYVPGPGIKMFLVRAPLSSPLADVPKPHLGELLITTFPVGLYAPGPGKDRARAYDVTRRPPR